MKRIIFVLASCFAALSYAQDDEEGPSPVRYTEAINKPVLHTVQLPGYLEAPNVSVLAGNNLSPKTHNIYNILYALISAVLTKIINKPSLMASRKKSLPRKL